MLKFPKVFIFPAVFFMGTFSAAAQPIRAAAQMVIAPFELNGTINIDSGSIFLVPVKEEGHYPHEHSSYATRIRNGKFSFSDSVAYPCAFRLMTNRNPAIKYFSDAFWVDTGIATIVCHIDSITDRLPITTTTGVGNKSMKEWKGDNRPAGNTLKISITYPDGNTAVNCAFPILQVLSEKNVPVAIHSTGGVHKFTLLYFWLSQCNDCISQFSGLKSLFNANKAKGFTITGISTDAQQGVHDWKAVIRKYALPWKQFLDPSGNEFHKLSGDGFPANFLLDEKGRIIAKNIDPARLATFLMAHLP